MEEGTLETMGISGVLRVLLVICNSQVESEEIRDSTEDLEWRETRPASRHGITCPRFFFFFFFFCAGDIPMSCVTLTRENLEPRNGAWSLYYMTLYGRLFNKDVTWYCVLRIPSYDLVNLTVVEKIILSIK